MRKLPFVQLDVFTRTSFEGNPLAVFPDAQGLTSSQMQLLAREMNLSETTFVLPPTKPGADYRVRIFTTVTELPYAGHPSIGTAWHLASCGRLPSAAPSTRVHQEVLAGVLPMDIDVDGKGGLTRVHTTQGRPTFQSPLQDLPRVAKALGLRAEDLDPELPPQMVSTGLPWFLVPLRDADALDRVKPDLAAFDGPGALHYNVYPFTLKPRTAGATTESRGLPLREFEDPVTGSASGCVGAYLVKHGVLKPKDGFVRFTNAQGRHVHRPGKAEVEVRVGPDGGPETVRVGGAAVQVLTGEVDVGGSP